MLGVISSPVNSVHSQLRATAAIPPDPSVPVGVHPLQGSWVSATKGASSVTS